jgi:hypothetical protein
MDISVFMPLLFLASGFLVICLSFFVAIKVNNTVLTCIGLLVGLMMSLFGVANAMGISYDSKTGAFSATASKVEKVDSEQSKIIADIRKNYETINETQKRQDFQQKKIDDQIKNLIIERENLDVLQDKIAKITQENIRQDIQIRQVRATLENVRNQAAPTVAASHIVSPSVTVDTPIKMNVSPDRESDARRVRSNIASKGAGVVFRITDFSEIANKYDSGIINIVYKQDSKATAELAKAAVEAAGFGQRIKRFERVEVLNYGDVQVNFW